jgi:prepilin-type N-terminal cleavage/methylation domain-containing protein/prepilin-type processing-associated H-X9-DG protein
MFSGRKGFTLIELLVVIAIIAILAAMLFPVFSSAKRQSKTTVCLMNMKQLSIGLSMYLADNEGDFPAQPMDDMIMGGGGVKNWKEPTAKPNWARSIEPYIKNKTVPTCPLSKKQSSCRMNCGMTGMAPYSYPLSIFGNGKVFKYGISESEITDSSNTVALLCCGQSWQNCFIAPFLNAGTGQWVSYIDKDWCAHNNGTNIIFTDCHAKWKSYDAISGDLSIYEPVKVL